MTKGYQIIEIAQLDELARKPEHHKDLVILLSWLIGKLNVTVGDQLQNVDIEVITVTYFGSYPALGVHYHDITQPDVSTLIETKAEELLKELPPDLTVPAR